MTGVDPFDEGVPRNGRGQPTIVPLKRGKPNPDAKLIPYTRASTFADALDNGGGLSTWKTRHAVLGVAQSPDLVAMAGALGRDLNDFTPEDKRNLDAITETAHDRSGGNAKANYGTAIHSLTEDPFDYDARERFASEQMTRDAKSYEAALGDLGLKVVESELFVVNDDLKVAGTFDHSYELTRNLTVEWQGEQVTIPAGTRLLGDKKTGSLHFCSHAIQLAVYARSKRYDHVTGERSALDVSPQWGILAHIARGEGKTAIYLVDLHAGWKACKLAAEVREYRSSAGERALRVLVTETTTTSIEVDAPVTDGPVVTAEEEQRDHGNTEPGDEFTEAANLVTDKLDAVDVIADGIAKAADGDALRALWSEHRNTWTDEHTAAVKARLAELAA